MADTPPAAVVAPPPGPIAGLAILGIVLVLIIAWVVIGGLFLQPVSLFGGFLMLWYWANNEQLQFKRLPAAIIGAVVGIALGWFIVYGTVQFGTPGTIAAVLLLVLALYLDIIKAMPLVVNTSSMLYVTVAAAPLVQINVIWSELVLSTVVGGLFFGLAVEGLQRLAARFAPAG